MGLDLVEFRFNHSWNRSVELIDWEDREFFP